MLLFLLPAHARAISRGNFLLFNLYTELIRLWLWTQHFVVLGLILVRQFPEVAHEAALSLQRLLHLLKIYAHLGKPDLRLAHTMVPLFNFGFICIAKLHFSLHSLQSLELFLSVHISAQLVERACPSCSRGCGCGSICIFT